MAISIRSRIVASAFALTLAFSSAGMTHAASDPLAVSAKRETIVASPNQPEPAQIYKADLQTKFLSHGSNGSTTVDLYQVKNGGQLNAQNVTLEKVCIFKTNSGGTISTSTQQVNVGTINAGGQIAHSVTCIAPTGKYVYSSTLKATTTTPESNTNNNHATSN